MQRVLRGVPVHPKRHQRADARRVGLCLGALALIGTFWGIVPTVVLGGLRNDIRAVRSGPDGVTIEVVTNVYTLQPVERDGQSWTVVTAAGYGMTETPGQPQLPVAGGLIGVPAEGSLSVEVVETTVEVVPGVLIALVPVMRAGPPAGDPASPERLVDVTRLGLFRSTPVAAVTVHPFVYHPITKELRIYTRLLINVRFLTTTPVTRPVTPFPRPPGAFDRTVAASLINGAEIERWRVPPSPVGRRKPTAGGAGTRCRIMVDTDGLYRVTARQLVDAGVDVRTIDPRTFSMTNKGQPVAILVDGEDDGAFDEEDGIELYGVGQRQTFQAGFPDMYRDPYTDMNVYWLSWGSEPGGRMARENGSLAQTDPARYAAPAWYESTVHVEQDVAFDRLGGSVEPMSDHWFWDDLNAGQSKDYTLVIPAPAPGADSPTTLRGMFHGRTESPDSPDHHLVMTALDRGLTADARWDGVAWQRAVDSRLAATARLRDTVTVSLTAPGDTPAGAVDAVRVNWLEVEYPRAYRAVDDQIVFTKPKHGPLGLYQFTIDGFSTPAIQVYKIGVSRVVNVTVTPVASSRRYRVTFQTPVLDPDTRFIALTPDGKRTLAAVQRVDPEPDLTDPTRGADYVIITHDRFYEAIQRLAAHRRSRGLRVETVNVSTIYDQFNDGILSPDAIRQFLRYAYAHWSPAPSYVLLVGDGSLDYKGREAAGSFVPVHLAQTVAFGVVGSDHPYALVSGDDLLPDLAVGRFPVRTVDEVNAIIEKTIAYETSPEWGDWRRTVFFVSGDQRGEFEAGSEALIQEYVPDAYLVARLSLLYTHAVNPDFDAASKQRLVSQLNDGTALLNFIGHGGGGTWSDRNIWEYDDISRMTNGGRLPVVVSMTCFTGSFDHDEDGLGERFLKTPGRGAVAFFGSTGAGWLYNDFYINQALLQSLFAHGTREVGRMFAEAKAAYLGVYGKGLSGHLARSQVFQYLLLGDPALAIGLPPPTVTLRATPASVFPGEQLRVEGRVTGAVEGTVDFALYRRPDAAPGEAILSVADVPVRDGTFVTVMTVPDTVSSGDAVVKAYHRSDRERRDGQGATTIAIGKGYIGNVTHSPASPGAADSVEVFAEVADRHGVAAVTCSWASGQGESHQVPMVPDATAGRYRTQRPIPPAPAGMSVTYTISALNQAGIRIASSAAGYRVRRPIDLTVVSAHVDLTGREAVQIAVRVRNVGETGADSVVVRGWRETPQGDQPIGPDQVIPRVAAGESAAAAWTALLPAGTQRVSVVIDPDARLDEPNRGNNRTTRALEVTRFQVTPDAGLTFDGVTSAWAASPDGQCVFSVPPGAVSRPVVLTVAAEPLPAGSDQPDVLPAWSAGRAYRLAFADSTVGLTGTRGIAAGIRYEASNPPIAEGREHLAVYRWAPEIERWLRLGGRVDSTAVTVESPRLGLFGLFLNDDWTPPMIDVAAGDRPLVDGTYLPAHARLSAVIQDANGVDTVDRRVEVLVDETSVDSTQVVYRAGPANANAVPVSCLLPSLEPGPHTVVIRATDCNGNQATSPVFRFVVESGLTIRQVGNYPNPMQRHTVFTYRLTAPADEFTLRVYTVDGRLVRTFSTRDATASGAVEYHEIVWDGTDDGGRLVANGVYFYRLTARMGERVVDRTMKLAVLR